MGWRGPTIWFEWGQRSSGADTRPVTGADWTTPEFALGAHPMLIQHGRAHAEVQPDVQVFSAIDWGNHPRTALAHTASGDILLITIDGRTSAGTGMSTPALANWIRDEFDVVSAINLDGGGSTTMAVNDCWVGSNYGEGGARAVNTPSDGRSRAVRSGIYLKRSADDF